MSSYLHSLSAQIAVAQLQTGFPIPIFSVYGYKLCYKLCYKYGYKFTSQSFHPV